AHDRRRRRRGHRGHPVNCASGGQGLQPWTWERSGTEAAVNLRAVDPGRAEQEPAPGARVVHPWGAPPWRPGQNPAPLEGGPTANEAGSHEDGCPS
ncbi:MAG TPA: hypothetical protein VFW21_11985, partial [Mycobacterium sp.]|nr:hypothetical protein [Mycobacterium sp.]